MALPGVFQNLTPTEPAPGSLFAVDFYKCIEDCHDPSKLVLVEVSYCPNGLDLEDSCVLVEYDH